MQLRGSSYLVTKELELKDHIYCGFWDLGPTLGVRFQSPNTLSFDVSLTPGALLCSVESLAGECSMSRGCCL